MNLLFSGIEIKIGFTEVYYENKISSLIADTGSGRVKIIPY